jgi:hypothetical protein
MTLTKTQGAYALLNEPIFQGSTLSPDVPGKLDVAIGGRAFMIDRTFSEFGTAHKDRSIELLRPQADNSQEPSEAGINPDATWIRSQHSWHHGAGQALFDRSQSDVSTPSDRERFSTSKGINVWTEGQIGLHKSSSFGASFDGNIVKTVGPYVAGTSPNGGLLFQTVNTTGTPVSVIGPNPFAGLTVTSLASDGFNLWGVVGSSGIYQNDIESFADTQYISDDCTGGVVGYVKARLMLGLGASIYNLITSGTLPTALFTHANSDFTWIGFADGNDQIYAAGYSGHTSLIYRIQVTTDGLTLDQPIVAGQLPDGERIYSIFGYLGFVFLGTSKGVRYCIPDAQGNLTIGDAIATPNPVECFAATDRWVWFGLTNYDGTSTGLGRMDLRTLADEGAQQLAWASDLMVTGQGRIVTLTTNSGIPLFGVFGTGYYYQDPIVYVASGQLTTGTLDFGMVPDKVTTSLDATFGQSFVGSVTAEISADDAAYETIGYESTADTLRQNWETRQARGSRFQLRFTLTRGSTLTAPTFTGWTLNAEPTGSFREQLIWPITLANKVQDRGGGEHYSDPQADLDYIKELHSSRTVVTCQRGKNTYRCVVTDYDARHDNPNLDGSWNGACIVYLKRVAA